MLRGRDFQFAPSEEMRMNICSIESVQRVVNFTLNNEKILREESMGGIIPGVTMICDLPLLFVNGLPTCLESLEVGQLETFVPYMVQCSRGACDAGTQPKWWPSELEFSLVPTKPSGLSDAKWLSCLKIIVANCYSYHGCDYALRLCVNPSHTCRSSEWTFIDGLDGTMSLYNKATRKLSASFRTANVACFKGGQILAKALVSKRAVSIRAPQKNQCSAPIYLCDTCDLEFSTTKEVQDHEIMCSQKHHSQVSCAPPSLLRPTRTCRTYVAPSSTTRNSESYIHNAPARSRNQSFPRNMLQQDYRKTLPHPTNSRLRERRLAHEENTVRNCLPCKSTSNYISFKRKRDHEASCIENRLETMPVLSGTSPSISAQTNLPHSISIGNTLPSNRSNTLTSNVSHNKGSSVVEIPLKRKKKTFRRMSLMPSKYNKQEDLKELDHTDIYLCGHCEMEFTTLIDIQNHEIVCCKKKDFTTAISEQEEKEFNQNTFLNYFQLKNALNSQLHVQSKESFPYKRSLGNPLRYSGIPISSPLGSQIHRKYCLSPSVISAKMEKIERYCSSTPHALHRSAEMRYDMNTWRVSYKPGKSKTKNWVHTYQHPLQQWWKMPLLRKRKMKVEERNQKLLSLCKPLQVKLRKLTAKEILSFTTCRTLAAKVKKLTSEEIQLYTNRCSVSPKLSMLSTQEIEIYTRTTPCTISPVIRRLSFQEIEKYTHPPTNINIILCNSSTSSDNGILSSSKPVSPNCAINKKKRKRKTSQSLYIC